MRGTGIGGVKTPGVAIGLGATVTAKAPAKRVGSTLVLPVFCTVSFAAVGQ